MSDRGLNEVADKLGPARFGEGCEDKLGPARFDGGHEDELGPAQQPGKAVAEKLGPPFLWIALMSVLHKSVIMELCETSLKTAI